VLSRHFLLVTLCFSLESFFLPLVKPLRAVTIFRLITPRTESTPCPCFSPSVTKKQKERKKKEKKKRKEKERIERENNRKRGIGYKAVA
jgi:hypothetical protein